LGIPKGELMTWISAMLVALVAFQAQAPDTDVTLARLEREWNAAHVQGDATSLERIFADDLVVVVPGMRPLSKADSLGMFKVGGMRFDRYESLDIQSRVYGDTAIVTGRIRRTRSIAGKTMDDDWRFTKVYLRRAGNWQVVSFHASNVAP
jgi:ketosteroid isomerase-like protein